MAVPTSAFRISVVIKFGLKVANARLSTVATAPSTATLLSKTAASAESCTSYGMVERRHLPKPAIGQKEQTAHRASRCFIKCLEIAGQPSRKSTSGSPMRSKSGPHILTQGLANECGHRAYSNGGQNRVNSV